MNILNDEIFYNDDGGMGKYIVNKLQLPPAQADPETVKKYERYGKRVLWIDDSVVPGSFQMNASWYKHSNMYVITESYQKGTDFLKPHKHETDEIVAFFGGNPEDPENLHGEIIFYINGEKHIITKSSFIFLPAGIEHGPLLIQKVNPPIFHFSCVLQKQYAAKVDAVQDENNDTSD